MQETAQSNDEPDVSAQMFSAFSESTSWGLVHLMSLYLLSISSVLSIGRTSTVCPFPSCRAGSKHGRIDPGAAWHVMTATSTV